MLRTLVQYTYVPLLLVGFNGTAVWAIASGHAHWPLIGLLALAIAISFAAEHIAPYEPDWNNDHRDRLRDAVHAFVNETSTLLAAGIIPLLAYLRPWDGFWPTGWPLWLQLLLAIVVADLGITFAHYLSHRWEWLWRFHAVHHSVKRMYGLNGLMKHPIHLAIETAVATLPLTIAGMPYEVAMLLGFAVAIQLLLQHSNADMRIGPLRYIFALAPLHRFHHQKEAAIGDVNFGVFTTLGDRLLGTSVYDGEKRFTSGDLGIGTQPNYPTTYLGQLAAPFRRQSDFSERP